jgi:hypothetical protein
MITVALRVEDPPSTPWDKMYWMRVSEPLVASIFNPAYFFPEARRGRTRTLNASFGPFTDDELWDKADADVKDTAIDMFEEVFPEAKGRVSVAVLQRWDPAFAAFPPGTEADAEQRESSVGRIHFCGDYLVSIGTDVALESGKRVAERVKEALRADARTPVGSSAR